MMETLQMTNTQPVKRLYRSRNDKIIAGVCGGIAAYSRIDPVIIRLAWALITLFSLLFVGIVVYLICWIVIPEAPEENPIDKTSVPPM